MHGQSEVPVPSRQTLLSLVFLGSLYVGLEFGIPGPSNLLTGKLVFSFRIFGSLQPSNLSEVLS